MFTLRSDIVLRVRALEVKPWNPSSDVDSRKRANFQIVGLFPTKTGGFKVGDKIQ